MTNPSNGATLEDCHSNFFALTDLCGIRWRRLVSDGGTGSTGHPQHHSFGPLDDPVLSSYARCLAADILCVWRRSPNSKVNQPSTPHDPFHPTSSTSETPPHSFMHPQVGSTPQQQMHNMQHQSHMMPPHLPLGMGPSHLGSHHMGGPPPYPHHVNHSHGFSPQLSPMHQSVYPSSSPNHNNPTLNGPKELWIFWYGEEPELTGLVNAQLLNKTDPDQGSWESGLSYECRTLLFKALHNLIEKCLLARDFVRLGKWFIQPCEDNQRIGVKNFPMQLSFSFAFFLHGESTVCMSVDVRQHPSIKRVSKQHLTTCQSPNNTFPVILAPHGLAGTLTGVGYRMSEAGTHKILEEWKQFYPVEAALKSPMYDTAVPQGSHSSPHPSNPQSGQSTNTGIPPVLEVLVGGVRMRYPACYVLVTKLDDPSCQTETSSATFPSTATPKSKSGANCDSEGAACPSVLSPGRPQGSQTLPLEVCKVEGILPERVWQEAILSSAKTKVDPNVCPTGQAALPNNNNTVTTNNTQVDTPGQWDFVDPMKRSMCTCSKCKRSSGSRSAGGSGGHSTKSGTKVRKSTFHKRTTHQMAQVNNWASVWDLPDDTSVSNSQPSASGSAKGTDSAGNNNQSSSNRVGAPPGTPLGGPPSFKAGGPGSMAGMGSEGPGPSPISVAPSPLATPRSQPPSVPQQEPSMPTLSPQPPGDKPSVATPDNGAPKSVSSISNQVFSPLLSGFDDDKNENPGDQSSTNGGTTTTGPESGTTATKSSKKGGNNSVFSRTLIRPALPSKDYEGLLREEDSSQPSDVIYDYSVLEAWLYHPVKRLKVTVEGQSKPSMYSWGWGMRNKPDSQTSLSGGTHERRHHHLGKRQADPYEFDEESHQAPAINMDGLKRKEGDEEKTGFCANDPANGNKVVSGNLFTNEGLQPSIRDLDNLFDNSDTSSDETFQVPTPPGSNKPACGIEETNINSIVGNSSKSRSGLGILRPEELSKMFPTPPSHEPNPISSPVGIQSDASIMEGLSDTSSSCIRRPQENYSGLGSPPDPSEPIDVRLETSNLYLRSGGQHTQRLHLHDWSFVFKPPTLYKMLGSSKYTPLSSLPSQLQPSLPLPPNNATYKATWQIPPTTQQQNPPPCSQQNAVLHPLHPPVQSQQQHPICVGPNMSNQMHHLRPGLSPISPVPNSVRGGSFEMGSPPSNNMYLKQGAHGGGIQHSHGAQPPPPHPPHPGHHPMYGSRGVEAHALVVNLSLSDSVINLFRDHNFDSCTMCVCNASNKVIGNIRGSEVGLYIHDPSPEEEQVRCNCGFSASANRRLAHRSGMFYEDEFEITTPSVAPIAIMSDELHEKKKSSFLLLDRNKYGNEAALNADKETVSTSAIVDSVPPFLLDILREQCLLMFGTNTASRFKGEIVKYRWSDHDCNVLECVDANRAALTALEHGRTVMLEASGRSGFPRMPEDAMPLKLNLGLMHKWAFIWARGPKSSQDVMQVMRALLPLLQEAVHAKAWDAQYNVSGPLTWRQFHRFAGRGTEDRCEPQPIPSILVGAEKDWIALSPLAIKYWEKLLLEPYAYPRDIAYIVLAPDNDLILQKVRTFFREFSSMYEVCQLGRHCPITKVLRDGILRVGKHAANRLSNEVDDDWFRLLPDHPTSAILRLYAQVCRHYLAPQLASISLDQSLFDTPSQRVFHDRSPAPAKMPPPTIDVTGNTQGPPTPKNEPSISENENMMHRDIPIQEPIDDDDRDPPAIVVYLIEPFGFGSDNEDLHRLCKVGLLRCYHSMLKLIPDHIKNNITLQVISLEDIMNLGNSTLDTRLRNDQMRALALSVYSQCRRLLIHQNNVKSLTGFGPAAAADLFMKTKDEKSRQGYRLYTPPYVLAPAKERLSEGSEWLNTLQGHTTGGLVSSGNVLTVGPTATPSLSSVLYVAYCISDDQRWLLASVTDDRGELLETATISIYVPNRSKRRKANARKHGLQKLMDIILGIMSTGVSPWRLVVGRLGRIGHGELESWSILLSRKSLLKASNHLKAVCAQCSLQYPTEAPCVLSACLVSLEPDSCLRLMPDKFTPDERFSSSGTSASLSTPQDISCTHILVFPTSATTQSSQTAFQEQHINGPELGDDSDLFFGNDTLYDDGIDGMNDLQLGDIFNWPDAGPGAPSPIGSPRRDSTSQPGSPGGVGGGRQSPFQSGGQGRVGGRGEGGDEVGTILQQPLALGYLVSTAPVGKLPSWFWASCPQRASEKGCGVFLKSALHLHSHSVFHNMDDLLQQQSNAKQHPLDSQYTTDVLRFVLEGYNALSWLALDPKTHDRKSCLPVHIQHLLQLYYTMSALV